MIYYHDRMKFLLYSTVAGCVAAGTMYWSHNNRVLDNTALEVVDWSNPVLWVRIANNNHTPIVNPQIEYEASDGKVTCKGVFTINGRVPGDTVRNFADINLPTISPACEKLTLKFHAVHMLQP